MLETHYHNTPKSPASKMSAYRQRMREAGLRPIQLWIPDIRSAKLQEEARRQSLAVAHSDKESLDFIEDVVDW
jgi:Protein  of unknown function (DUF3018)